MPSGSWVQTLRAVLRVTRILEKLAGQALSRPPPSQARYRRRPPVPLRRQQSHPAAALLDRVELRLRRLLRRR
jgi:hypothetical protein